MSAPVDCKICSRGSLGGIRVSGSPGEDSKLAERCCAICSYTGQRCCLTALPKKKYCAVHVAPCRDIYNSYKGVEILIEEIIPGGEKILKKIRLNDYSGVGVARVVANVFTKLEEQGNLVRLRNLLQKLVKLRDRHLDNCFSEDCRDELHPEILDNYRSFITLLDAHVIRLRQLPPSTPKVHSIMGSRSKRSVRNEEAKLSKSKVSKGSKTMVSAPVSTPPEESLDDFLEDFRLQNQKDQEEQKISSFVPSGLWKSIDSSPLALKTDLSRTKTSPGLGEVEKTELFELSVPLFPLDQFELNIVTEKKEGKKVPIKYTVLMKEELKEETIKAIKSFQSLLFGSSPPTSTTRLGPKEFEGVSKHLKEISEKVSRALGMPYDMVSDIIFEVYMQKWKILSRRLSDWWN